MNVYTAAAIVVAYTAIIVGLFWFVLWIIIRTANRQIYGDKDPNQKLRETIARHAQSEQPRSHVGGIEALDDRGRKAAVQAEVDREARSHAKR